MLYSDRSQRAFLPLHMLPINARVDNLQLWVFSELPFHRSQTSAEVSVQELSSRSPPPRRVQRDRFWSNTALECTTMQDQA